ncbi:MAG: CarD family transcriptional regulator [Terrisporobacter sp.]|uniref:CarD family transcriptional regulator n=1 Tax=Terrisporobacter sp. TaxID=1965305 RepID=UPI002FCA4705
MYNINDYIIYGSMSVCKVIDIIEEDNKYNNYKDYYVLQPLYSDKSAIIKVPVENVSVFMRPILSKDDVMSLIHNMNKIENLWIDNDKQRSNEFKSIIKNNISGELAQLIQSIYQTKEEKTSAGKKISKYDEEIMKSAEKLLEEEFATVLNINVEDVQNFILSHMSE